MSRYTNPADVKVGIAGYGGRWVMGRTHMTQMQQVGFTPTAIADLLEEPRKLAASDWPDLEIYTSADELLEKSDVNLIALVTPHNTHGELALRALRSGRHVVLEKPFAITLAECDEMIAEAQKRNLLLTTYHNRHWDGCILRALEVIRGGEIGEVMRVEVFSTGMGAPDDRWRFSKTVSGGIMYDWGVHYLEYALQILDDTPVEISGYATNGVLAPISPWKDDAVEDEATAIVRFSRGARLEITFTNVDASATAANDCPITVTGTEGVYRFGLNAWRLYRRGAESFEEGENPPNEWERFYENVAANLVEDKLLVINPAWARRPIEILYLSRRSARENRTITVGQ